MSTHQIGGFTARLAPALPLSVQTSGYASGDLIGTLLTFSLGPDNPAQRGATGTIHSVQLFDAGATKANVTVVLFDRMPAVTPFTDGSALDIADGDGGAIFATVSLTQYTDFNDSAFGAVVGLGRPFQCAPGANSLWAAVMADASATFAAAGDLRLSLGAFLDQREPA
ncbi:MAG: hypothetical protein ACFB6R_07430 [Alphaproteobacteria bacterium]